MVYLNAEYTLEEKAKLHFEDASDRDIADFILDLNKDNSIVVLDSKEDVDNFIDDYPRKIDFADSFVEFLESLDSRDMNTFLKRFSSIIPERIAIEMYESLGRDALNLDAGR